MNNSIETIKKTGIVPVAAIENAEDAVPLARALSRGGISCVEVTFRTKAAAGAISNISTECPEMLVGAGTVLTVEQVKDAVEAGAAFIVSPGFNPKIVDYCIEHDISVIPGVSGPSEVEAALERGLQTVKFFPAEASGGIDYLKALWGPYRNMDYIPTGGINADNLNDYLQYKKIAACGGSWMVKPQFLEHHDFEKIEALTREAVERMLDFRIRTVSFSSAESVSSELFHSPLGRFLGAEKKDAGGQADACAGEQAGTIYVETASLERAVYYLEKAGIEIAEKVSGTGEITLGARAGNFAVKLVEK